MNGIISATSGAHTDDARTNVLLSRIDDVLAAEIAGCFSTRPDLWIHKPKSDAELAAQVRLHAGSIIVLGRDAGLGNSFDPVMQATVESQALVIACDTSAGRDAGIPLFYGFSKMPGVEDLAAVIEAALGKRRSVHTRIEGRRVVGKDALRLISELVVKLCHEDATVDVSAGIVAASLKDLLHADRAYFVNQTGSDVSPTGLTGYLMRCGGNICIDDVREDPRYSRDCDDPEGVGNERLIGVALEPEHPRASAVLVAMRSADSAPFSLEDQAALHSLCEHLGHLWDDIAKPPALAEATTGEATFEFRKRALARHAAGTVSYGDPVRLSPGWMNSIYHLLVASLAVAAMFAVFVPITDYARGPAIVELSNDKQITSPIDGTVSTVYVSVGDKVRAGQQLLSFYSANQDNELERARDAFRLELVKRLYDPNNPSSAQTLTGLRAQLELATKQLAQQTLTAQHDGVVTDVAAQPGERFEPGQSLLSIGDGEMSPEVVAFVPGYYRPRLKIGQPLHLQLQGYDGAHQDTTVTYISSGLVGPDEALRYVSPDIADSLKISGPVIVVKGRITSGTFQAEGKEFSYHAGMPGTVDVKVGTQRLISRLLPGLKLFGDGT